MHLAPRTSVDSIVLFPDNKRMRLKRLARYARYFAADAEPYAAIDKRELT
jgi:hypothetical protein